MSALNKSLVCVLNAGREPAGGGVLISPRHVLSCAHVVAESLGIAHTQAEPPKGRVGVVFPLLKEPRIYAARVLYWLPTKKNSHVGSTGDIVVLELLEAVPSEADVVCLNVLESTAFAQRVVRMCGFPNKIKEGQWLTGRLAGLVQTGFVQLDNEVGRRCVTHGFSGSPVWDEETQSVIGVISFIKKLGEQPPAYVIPLNAIFQQLPELEKVEGLVIYSDEDKKMSQTEKNSINFDNTQNNYNQTPSQQNVLLYVVMAFFVLVGVMGGFYFLSQSGDKIEQGKGSILLNGNGDITVNREEKHEDTE